MKKTSLYCALCAVALSLVAGCKKIPDGNISNIIRYEVLPIEVPRGRAYVSTAINPEGSTKPLNIKLTNIYDRETGADVTGLFMQKYEHRVWKGLYDPKMDTTLAMIDAKLIDSLVYPISINPVSGQLEANFTTVNLPLGKYRFDLEISNPAGTKTYRGIGEFDLVDAPLYEVPAVRSTVAMMVGAETTTRAIPSNNSHIRVERLGDGDKIIVRIVDKDGVPFNPRKGEIARRPLSGTAIGFLQTLQDYTFSTELLDDRMEFAYPSPVLPFPLSSLGNGFNYYYRIPAQFVEYDAALGLPYNTYSCNVRFSFRTFAPGTYQIDVIVPQVTRKAD